MLHKDNTGKLITSMNCTTCKTYEDRICSIKNFNFLWGNEGSKRLQHSAAVEHAVGEPHKKSFDLYMKSKGLDLLERTEKTREILNSSRQENIVSGLAAMKKQEVARTKRKFETAYFLAKEEIPLVKYSRFVSFMERQSVDIGQAYRNENTGGEFVDYIDMSIAEHLKGKIENSHFYSVLTDGSTDSSISENEAVFVVFFEPTPPGRDRVKVTTSYVRLVFMESADARGVISCIDEAFKSIGIANFKEKLVGFGADGASVNQGKKEGVKTILLIDCPWLVFGWCMAHRLELALKDALSGTAFKEVDEVILRMYYLYKRSPKKLRQLKELVDIYEDGGEFAEGAYKPKKASG